MEMYDKNMPLNVSAKDNSFDSLLVDSKAIIEQARSAAYRSINVLLVQRNWLLGRRIFEEQLGGDNRAEYGKQIISNLSEQLTAAYGDGFTETNLYYYIDFAKSYPELFCIDNQADGILHTVCGKSDDMILHTVCGKSDIYSVLVSSSPIRLSWSHYRTLLQVSDDNARLWYENESAKQTWSVRTLQRNISSQYYYRLLQSPSKEKVEAEMKSLTAPQFLMEMGKGFAFVDRQKHIQTEKRDYYIDLVFYNYLLKCFILVDLKTSTVDYQDAGQMQMYVSMYDEKYRSEGDNPTIGILLCADTDEDVAKYSSLHDNDQLYMAKYLTYMPTQEQMRREIEQQKMIFELKQRK